MAGLAVRCLVLLCAVTAVAAECYRGPLRHDRGGRYCQTKGAMKERVDYGMRKKTDNCYDCSCGPQGLHCCGFGIKAGSNAQHVPVPPGCMLVVEGCDYYFLNRYTLARC